MSFDDFWESNQFGQRITCKKLFSRLPAFIKEPPVVWTKGLIQSVQMELFGPDLWITQERCSSITPQSVWTVVKKHASSAKALCPTLLEIIEKEVHVGDKDVAIAILRDLGRSFAELAKIRKSVNQLTFEEGGMSTEDAQNISLGIYSKKRRNDPNTVVERSRLQAAEDALKAQDESISISNCSLDHNKLDALKQLIEGDAALKALDLSCNNIHVAGSATVAGVIRKSKGLRHLNVAGNNLLRDGVEKVLAAVKEHQNLTCLNIAACHTGPTALASLKALEGYSALTHLNVSANGFGHLSTLPIIPSLRVLDISSNFLSSADIQFLTSKPPSTIVERLNLSNNCIDDRGVELLSKNMASFPFLTTVDFTANPITDASAPFLQGIIEYGMMSTLTFGNSHISEAVALELGKSVATKQLQQRQRVESLKSTPMSDWSVMEAALVMTTVIHEQQTLAKLLGKSGKEIAALRASEGVVFDRSDFKRLEEFQLACC